MCWRCWRRLVLQFPAGEGVDPAVIAGPSVWFPGATPVTRRAFKQDGVPGPEACRGEAVPHSSWGRLRRWPSAAAGPAVPNRCRGALPPRAFHASPRPTGSGAGRGRPGDRGRGAGDPSGSGRRRRPGQNGGGAGDGGRMPLVVLCGRPGSGKSRRAAELREALGGPERQAHVVAEAEGGRAALRAEVERRLSRRDVVIVDAGNELRSIRYELYCAARQAGTARCLLHCAGGPGGPDEPPFEAPDPRNRWDRPLFTVGGEEPLPLAAIRAALFESAPPPPHRATRSQPLQSSGFLHHLDRVTQEVLAAVMAAQRSGAQPGEVVRVPGVAEGLVLNRPVSMAELSRLRRQFISYTKMQPSDENLPQLASMFLQYLSRSIQ
ncbi:protein KTI12 homolog [Haliaeetus albicilla]